MGNQEIYGSGWVKATVMVHPSGEIHYIDGDRGPGDGDRPYLASKYLHHNGLGELREMVLADTLRTCLVHHQGERCPLSVASVERCKTVACKLWQVTKTALRSAARSVADRKLPSFVEMCERCGFIGIAQCETARPMYDNCRAALETLNTKPQPGIYTRTVSAQELGIEGPVRIRLPGPSDAEEESEEWPSYEDACEDAGVTLCLVGSEKLYDYLTDKMEKIQKGAE